MSGTDKAESRRADESPESSAKSAKARKKRGAAPADLGRALRSVYDETLREDVPDDFLDLLGKLE
ncbi:NepR family anti-sigma factor [Sphingomonas arenae]|uniref:NepR family anti-sigma factor n=1 Tax=Sphingomonas arenae TaxID=2812555 RepID=UPI0019670F2D|nr:NepR family anti-sigma factor [Sphingomonas arenae]